MIAASLVVASMTCIGIRHTAQEVWSCSERMRKGETAMCVSCAIECSNPRKCNICSRPLPFREVPGKVTAQRTISYVIAARVFSIHRMSCTVHDTVEMMHCGTDNTNTTAMNIGHIMTIRVMYCICELHKDYEI